MIAYCMAHMFHHFLTGRWSSASCVIVCTSSYGQVVYDSILDRSAKTAGFKFDPTKQQPGVPSAWHLKVQWCVRLWKPNRCGLQKLGATKRIKQSCSSMLKYNMFLGWRFGLFFTLRQTILFSKSRPSLYGKFHHLRRWSGMPPWSSATNAWFCFDIVLTHGISWSSEYTHILRNCDG